MDLYKAIHARRSVRKFHPEGIDDDVLHRILEAGRMAPSGRNRQSWKFVVVRDAAIRQQLADASGQPFIATAPVVVVVGLDPQRVMFCGVPADPVDCAIAIEHMALAATAEGLGSCWIGHFDQNACREILGVPGEAKIIEMLLIGHAAEHPGVKQRKPLDEVVSYDRFE